METYSITDLIGYCHSVRDAAASDLKKDYTENLDDFVTINQVKSIIKDHSVGTDDDDNFLINEEIHNEIYDSIQVRIFNVGLAKLAANGFIECAWDDDNNEMIFWASDTKNQNDNPAKPKRKSRKDKKNQR